MEAITEFELGVLYAMVKQLKKENGDTSDKTPKHIGDISLRDFASELLYYAQQYYKK